MALEIVFLDGPPLMELGARTRIRVMQRDAGGQQNPMLLKDVAFSYSPLDWGRVDPTPDPAIGLLEVTRVVESDDVLLAPTFSISASLTHFTGHTFQSERRVRLLATAIEIELQFEVGNQSGKWRRFAASELRQPIDWTKARLGDPATESLVVRDGKPYLRLASLDALPAEVSITFPNGDVASLTLEGTLRAVTPGDPRPATPAPAPSPVPVATPPPAPVTPQRVAPPTPPAASEVTVVEAAPAPEPAPAPAPAAAQAPSSVDLREEIVRLRRYVSSFAGSLRARPDAKVADGIRQRIQREVERVKAIVDLHRGPDHDDLVAQFEAAAHVPGVAPASR